MTPKEMERRVLYRDGLMLIVDKPAGMAVHRGPKGGASLEDCFDDLRFGLPRPPALAHRLDRDTSGCLVLGRHRKALAHLGALFKHGRVGKTYWAIVEGGPDANYGHAPRHGGPPLHLHAAEVVVPLYPKRAPIRVTAPVPEHMRELLMQCGWTGEVD